MPQSSTQQKKIDSCEGLVVDSRQGPLCNSVAGVACALEIFEDASSKSMECWIQNKSTVNMFAVIVILRILN